MAILYRKAQAGIDRAPIKADSINTTSRYLPHPKYPREFILNPNYTDPKQKPNIDPGFNRELPRTGGNIDPGFSRPVSDTVNRDPGFSIDLPKNEGMKKYMDMMLRTKPDTTGQLKFQEGGDGNAINRISPNAKNAIMDARDSSFANPESSVERYYNNFKPATGEIEFDPATQLVVGELAGLGMNLAGQGINAIKKGIAGRAASQNEARASKELWRKIQLAKEAEHVGAMPRAEAIAYRNKLLDTHYKTLGLKNGGTMKGILYRKGQQGIKAPTERTMDGAPVSYNNDGVAPPIEVGSSTFSQNQARVNPNAGADESEGFKNIMNLPANTGLGRYFEGMSPAQTHAFTRNMSVRDFDGNEVPYGQFEDMIKAPGYQEKFNANPQLANKYKDPEAYRLYGQDYAYRKAQQAALQGGTELPSQYNENVLQQYTTANEQTLGSAYPGFQNRLPQAKATDTMKQRPAGAPAPGNGVIQKRGGLLYK